MYAFFIAILCIVVVILLLILIKHLYELQETAGDRKYAALHGEVNDENAHAVIIHTRNMREPRALDHYRAGATLLLNLRDVPAAHQHFNAALTQIIQEREEPGPGVPFILDHIADLVAAFELVGDDLPLQEAIFAHHNTKPAIKIDRNDPAYKEKTIITQQEWQIDPQNVHDSAMHDSFKEQYELVAQECANLPNIAIHDTRELSRYLAQRVQQHEKQHEKHQLTSAHLVLLLNNIKLGAIVPELGVPEPCVIQTVWQRSFDPRNAANRDAMHGALLDACAACIEGGQCVCITGRTKQIWASMAHLDFNPEVGIFKSKQTIRNEIYQKCAVILAGYVGDQGCINPELKNAFNLDADTVEVHQLRDTIKKNMIDEITQNYAGLLPHDQLDDVLKTCINVI